MTDPNSTRDAQQDSSSSAAPGPTAAAQQHLQLLDTAIHTTPHSHGLVQFMLTSVVVPFQRSGGVEPSAPGRQLLVRGKASGGGAR